MKLQVRKGIFETNSSSVHTLTMCSDSDYEDWKEGKQIYNRWNRDLELVKEGKEYSMERGYYTYDEFWSEIPASYDTFEEFYNNVVAFGYYGFD